MHHPVQIYILVFFSTTNVVADKVTLCSHIFFFILRSELLEKNDDKW